MLIVDDATICPPRALKFGYVSTGIFDGAGQAVPIPVMFTSTDSIFPVTPRRPRVPQETLHGQFIWGGVAFSAFGHWLTETFPLLATMREMLADYPKAQVLMVRRPGSDSLHWSALNQDFAACIGFDLARIRIVDTDCRVEQLIVPPDAFGRANHYKPSTIRCLDTLGIAPECGNGRRLFLSRGRLGGRERTRGDIEKIEARFARAGYEIIYPEQLSLAAQMEQILGASHLAGENGSAPHWSLFSPHVRSVISLGWHLRLQEGICAARGQVYIRARMPVIAPFFGRRQPVPLGVVDRSIARALSFGG